MSKSIAVRVFVTSVERQLVDLDVEKDHEVDWPNWVANGREVWLLAGEGIDNLTGRSVDFELYMPVEYTMKDYFGPGQDETVETEPFDQWSM